LAGRPRLSDVARAAGVHTTTVSRALRGSEGVGEETAERIRRVAADLGYLPHPAATSLRTGRSRMIGVVVPRLTDLVLATIYEGIEEGAAAAGYQTVVANSGDDIEIQRLRTETLLGMRVDGLILGDARTDSGLVRGLLDSGAKVVLTSRRLPGVTSVTCDDLEGGRLAGRHLLELGHRRVGIIAGRPYASTGIERTLGFREVYAEAGVPVPDERVLHSPFDAEGGRRAAEALLALDPRPSAIYAVNDFAAIGAMGAIREAGLRVGADVSVVGYNDVSIAADLPVSLTTVRSPMREMGRGAAAAIVKLIEGRPARSRRLAPELVRRASSVPPPDQREHGTQ
jgi:LacI family transcriptional regulator